MVFVGGNVPPPLFEIDVTDRAFQPKTAKIAKAGQRLRFKASGTLNHLITCGELQSPLLRPGHTWILDTVDFNEGSTEVQCEVTCMKMHVEVAAPAAAAEEEKENAADEGDEEEEEEEEGEHVDEMLSTLRAKLGVSPTLNVGATSSAAAADADSDDDERDFKASRQRHGAIARPSREI